MDDARTEPTGEQHERRPARAPASDVNSGRDRRRRRAKWIRRALLVLVGLAVLGALVMAFLPKPVEVDLARAEVSPLQVTVDEDGRTRVRDRYTVSAPIAAKLDRIEVRAGDAVEPEQVLARLTPVPAPLLDTRALAEARARVGAARAAREQARAGIERIRNKLGFAERETQRQAKLEASGATSTRAREQADLEASALQKELASAEFGARVSDHELDLALATLGHTGAGSSGGLPQLQLTSPIAGQVLKVLQESEGMVQAGTALLELGDPNAMEVVVDVLTADAVRIAPRMRVAIDRWGGQSVLRAHVRRVEPSAFTRVSALGVEEQRVNVIIDMDQNRTEWAALGDGFRVEASIEVWRDERVLSVPASSLFRRGEDWALFRVAGSKAQLRVVRLGHRNPERVEILSGLRKDDFIVMHPSDRVHEGVSVVAR